MKKLLKWLAGLLLVLFLIVGAGIFMLYSKSFKLKPWEYPPGEVASRPLPERPNILFLVAEDMSPRVGAFGDSLAQTPTLDRLAAAGVRYTRVFTTAGVCAPSRAALITGMNQISMGGQHMRTDSRPAGSYYCVPPPQVKGYPELLRAAGYYTFNLAKEDYQFSHMRTGTGPFTIWDAEDDNDLWRSRKEGQPFFGMINMMETHETGLFTPLGHWPHSMMHLMIQVLRPAMLMSRSLGIKGEAVDPEKILLPPYYPDTKTVRSDIARFYRNINAMDALVGNILERLKRDGLWESTIVVWTTDHGDCLPRAKRDLTDSGLEVPMIIYWPEAYRPGGVKPGTVDSRLISFVDLAPTFLDLAGAPIPDYMQGISLLSDSVRQYIYAAKDRMDEVYYRQRAVRDTAYKYIRSWYPQVPDGSHIAFRDNIEMMRQMWVMLDKGELSPEQRLWFEPTGEERLYDLKKDPLELHNVAGDTAYAAVLKRMRGALDDWLGRIGDWSEVTEDEMVKRFYPGGKRPVTPAPQITRHGDQVVVTCPEEGASLGYRLDEGPWQLYTGPVHVPEGHAFAARAVRYGWQESETAVLGQSSPK